MALSALDGLTANGLTSNGLTTAAASSRAETGGYAEARRTAQDFESVFLATMLNAMMPKSDADPAFGGGSAEATWRGMLVEEQAKTYAAAGGIGLADDITRQLLAVQEGQSQ